MLVPGCIYIRLAPSTDGPSLPLAAAIWLTLPVPRLLLPGSAQKLQNFLTSFALDSNPPTLPLGRGPQQSQAPSTNTASSSPAEHTRNQAQPLQLSIPSSSFSPLPTFEDASSSKRSSGSPRTSRSTQSVTRTLSSHSPNSFGKSRTPTPTSSVTLGGGSFSDSEPPRSFNVRTPTAVLRSYASDDEERKYLSARRIPPSKPAPTKSLPPPPEASSYAQLTSDAKLAPSVRRLAVSASRSPSFRFTSGSESASESVHGYTSASGSESAATGLGLGFRIRTRSSQGHVSDSGSTSRAATVRVGLLRAPNSFTGSKVTSPPSPPKSQAISLPKSSSPISTPPDRAGSLRSSPPSQSSVRRASPPIQGAASKSSSEMPGMRLTEPVKTAPSAKHASWLVIPKAAHTSPANPPGVTGGQVSVSLHLASDSRTLTKAAVASSVGASLSASSTGAQSINTARSSSVRSVTPPSNLSKSPSIAVVSSTQTNRVGSGSSSPPPAGPLPKLPRPNLTRTSSEMRTSSEVSQQAGGSSKSSPSSSESSTRTLTISPIPSSASNALSASGSSTVSHSGTDSSNALVSSLSGSTTTSVARSTPAVQPSTSGSVRRAVSKDGGLPTNKDRSKDSTWPSRSTSKRSSPPVSSPLNQSHTSYESPPYASPSSFSASTKAPSPLLSSQSSPSRVVVPVPPTPANIFALQTENAELRAEIASLRAQLETADRLARRREREIRGLRWLVINWGGDKKETLGFATTTEPRPSGDTAESQEEVQAAVRYLRAESESGYGSGSVSGSHSRMSHSSAYSSVYPAESVSDGSGSEVGIAQRTPYGPGPSARASEDKALDAIPERTVVGDEDTETTEAERRRKKDERRASRALKRLSASTGSDSHGSGLDEVVAQAMYSNHPVHGRAMSIEQVIEDERGRREHVGLKGMDEVLDKLRAVAGVAAPTAGPG
ncbi:hypothetical protein BJV78DRAFT_1286720 [Lactifluus subvellereus]|nr:hypothetical protein BJV78DRAFT_1286720 [Lactifluus subvellereus]